MEARPAIEVRPTLGKQLLKAFVKWFTHLFALLVPAVYLTQVVPYFTEFFEKNDTDLPAATVGVIECSWFLLDYSYLCVLGFVLYLPLLILLEAAPQRFGWIRSLWFVGLLVAVILAMGLMSLAVGLPFMQ